MRIIMVRVCFVFVVAGLLMGCGRQSPPLTVVGPENGMVKNSSGVVYFLQVSDTLIFGKMARRFKLIAYQPIRVNFAFGNKNAPGVDNYVLLSWGRLVTASGGASGAILPLPPDRSGIPLPSDRFKQRLNEFFLFDHQALELVVSQKPGAYLRLWVNGDMAVDWQAGD